MANFAERPDGTAAPRLTREHHREIVYSMWAGDPRPLFPKVAVPALVAAAVPHDADDARRAGPRAALALIPDATVSWYVDADHDLHAQRPERLVADLLTLAARAESGAPMSRIVVMGSGETTPTMVRIHREVFASSPPGPAVMIDTPFAFQMNRDELVARTRLYFSQSVGRELDVVEWPPREDGTAASERPLALLDQATWAFAGPGSPTYALGQWRGTGIPAALTGVVRRGGTVVFGSAAALTLGTHTIPVYEIYKVGAEPEWVDGLDLMGQLCGFPVALIPHYDNREGGTHDTRFCYLGELRLAMLEAQLPDEVGVLGVDEHTAMVIDLEAGSVTVSGNGVRQCPATWGHADLRCRRADRAHRPGGDAARPDVAAAPAARAPERSDDVSRRTPTSP